jgi:hypothetical protein
MIGTVVVHGGSILFHSYLFRLHDHSRLSMFSKEGPDAIPKSPLCFPIYLILESKSEKGNNRSRNCLLSKCRRLSAFRADSRRPKQRQITNVMAFRTVFPNFIGCSANGEHLDPGLKRHIPAQAILSPQAPMMIHQSKQDFPMPYGMFDIPC